MQTLYWKGQHVFLFLCSNVSDVSTDISANTSDVVVVNESGGEVLIVEGWLYI